MILASASPFNGLKTDCWIRRPYVVVCRAISAEVKVRCCLSAGPTLNMFIQHWGKIRGMYTLLRQGYQTT